MWFALLSAAGGDLRLQELSAVRRPTAAVRAAALQYMSTTSVMSVVQLSTHNLELFFQPLQPTSQAKLLTAEIKRSASEMKKPNGTPSPTKKIKKRKKKKDPNAPKRNQSAFFLYSNATRADIKAAQPDLAFGEIAKVISVNFKALPAEERAYWDEKAAADKERYQREMAAYRDEA